jgi:hypothetical protein
MPQTRRAKRAGSTAFDRLQTSIEGAESALKDLRGDVSRDSRERLNDVATTLKSARRNLIRSRQRIVKDLEQQIEKMAKGKKRPASKRGTKRGTKPARASTSRSRKAATAKSTAKRRTKAASRTKTASRSKAAAKPRAKRAAKAGAKS